MACCRNKAFTSYLYYSICHLSSFFLLLSIYLCLSIQVLISFPLFLVRGLLLYNTVITVMDFAMHQHESALGMHMSPPSWNPSHLPPHPIPLGCHRAVALGFLYHTSNTHWLSILYIVVYMFQDFMKYADLVMNFFFNF